MRPKVHTLLNLILFTLLFCSSPLAMKVSDGGLSHVLLRPAAPALVLADEDRSAQDARDARAALDIAMAPNQSTDYSVGRERMARRLLGLARAGRGGLTLFGTESEYDSTQVIEVTLGEALDLVDLAWILRYPIREGGALLFWCRRAEQLAVTEQDWEVIADRYWMLYGRSRGPEGALQHFLRERIVFAYSRADRDHRAIRFLRNELRFEAEQQAYNNQRMLHGETLTPEDYYLLTRAFMYGFGVEQNDVIAVRMALQALGEAGNPIYQHPTILQHMVELILQLAVQNRGGLRARMPDGSFNPQIMAIAALQRH